MTEKITMPFTNEDPAELQQALYLIVGSSLPVEMFDAFLSEYGKTNDLDKAIFFAECEWDC